MTWIHDMQRRAQDMVADKKRIGTHQTGRTGYKSELPRIGPNGEPVSKKLRKARKRLAVRLKDHAATVNRDPKAESAFRKPGSMKTR